MSQVKEGSLASQSASPRNVVVVGGGVIGLTTALVLSRDHSHCVTLVAKHLPGDSSQYYTSPWAGANFLPFSAAGTKEHRWERDTWPALAALATDCPETGIHFQDTILYTRRKDCVDATASVQCELHSPEPWFKDLLPNFRIDYPTVADSPDVMFTTHFTSVCINPVLYLPWLLGQCLRHGVQVKRASLNHILDAVKLHHTGLTADVVINCTGLGAAQLDGVRDTTVVPVRGQTILVNSDPGCMIGVSGSDEGTEELTYVMKRAGGGGTVLGGSYHRALDKSEADPDLAARILRRCVSYCPQLAQKLQEQGTLDFLSHRIGFRPCRTAGPRVEQERLGNINIVHNYGHGGFGYQTSYACAYDVAKMVHAMAASTPLAKL